MASTRRLDVTAAARVARRYPSDAALDTRQDYKVLTAVVSACRRSIAVKLVVGIILHGFYHEAAVRRMMKSLNPPTDAGVSSAQWAQAMRSSLDRMIRAGQEYDDRQRFPYPWIKDGTQIAVSLRSRLRQIHEACICIGTHSHASMSVVDQLLPSDMGWYSVSATRRCQYMRRHLARWISCFVYPHGRVEPADWNLCLHGMGSGPPRAAAILGIDSYVQANIVRRAVGKALQRPYSLYDLACFLCLQCTALSMEILATRRRAVATGIHRRRENFIVQWYDGARTHHVGTVKNLAAARKLYASAVRLGMPAARHAYLKTIKHDKFKGVYSRGGKYQAWGFHDSKKHYIGLYASKAKAAAAVAAYYERA